MTRTDYVAQYKRAYAKRAKPTGEQHEKANSEVYAMQGLPQPIQVQVDGQVHDEGRL
jgi:hypothetical protein